MKIINSKKNKKIKPKKKKKKINKKKKMNDTSDLGTSVMTIRYKMVFVGDISVGKTSIMNRFISNDFKEGYDVK